MFSGYIMHPYICTGTPGAVAVVRPTPIRRLSRAARGSSQVGLRGWAGCGGHSEGGGGRGGGGAAAGGGGAASSGGELLHPGWPAGGGAGSARLRSGGAPADSSAHPICMLAGVVLPGTCTLRCLPGEPIKLIEGTQHYDFCKRVC